MIRHITISKLKRRVCLIQNRFMTFFAIILFLSISVNSISSIYDYAKLRVMSIDWSERSWNPVVIDTIIIQISEGESFGGKNGPKYFKLLQIVDDQTIEILFSDKLVVAGEPTTSPSKQNPILISGSKNCFRTRLDVSGTDYCIDVLEVRTK